CMRRSSTCCAGIPRSPRSSTLTLESTATMPVNNLAFVQELFREYAAITVPLHGAVIADDKADGSSVTRADREASAHVLARLNRYTPDYGVISEEERVS